MVSRALDEESPLLLAFFLRERRIMLLNHRPPDRFTEGKSFPARRLRGILGLST